jgi:hypothetical protein
MYAEIIWAHVKVNKTTFFSPAESSFQFGLLAHRVKRGRCNSTEYRMEKFKS